MKKEATNTKDMVKHDGMKMASDAKKVVSTPTTQIRQETAKTGKIS